MSNEKHSKILLIEPPFYRLFKDSYSLDRYPLSLGYLGGEIVRHTNWDVLVYNADFQPSSEPFQVEYLTGIGFDRYIKNLQDTTGKVWKDIQEAIEDYQPDVVGLSAKSQNFKSALIIARLVKQYSSSIKVVMGGPHPSMVGPDIMKNPEVDICVAGEGESTIIELLDAIENHKNLNSINGIIYKSEDKVIVNKPRKYIKNLDHLCFPHQYASRILKDYEQYPADAFMNIFAIRGCPNNCFFCGSRNIWSRRVRFRSPENVIEEIQSLRNIGVNTINFDDDTFGVTSQYINSLCKAIMQNCPNAKWHCEIPVNLVTEKNISLMKEAGCTLIKIGIESGNNEILRIIRKKITIEEAINACKMIKKFKIGLHAFFIVGFPQDTEDTLLDTIKIIKKIKCDRVAYSIFTPYPGTEAFRFCKEKGLIGENYDVSLHNHQSPLNNFCMNIPLIRFRNIVSEVEKAIDRKNSMSIIKNMLSMENFKKIYKLGVIASFKKLLIAFSKIKRS